jgi:ATP-binding cassette, subfamily B, bacterial PglK
MIQNIKKLFSLMTKSQKKQFYKLQFLAALMAIAEISSIALIGMFMAIVGDLEILEGSGKLAEIYHISGIEEKEEFLFLTGVIVLCVMVIATTISIYTVWKLSLFASRMGVEISNSLFVYYINQSWSFHLSRNSTQLIKKIATESGRMAILVVSPLLQIGAKAILILFMSIAIFSYNPKITVIVLLTFSLSYIVIFSLVRSKLKKNGRVISEQNGRRFKLMSDSFEGIQNILLLDRKKYYINNFLLSGRKFARSQGLNQAFSVIPKYIIELSAFGVIIFLILYLIKIYEGNLSEILPVLAIYALSGFKLLPAFQGVYANLSHVRGNIASFEEISKDLEDSHKGNSNIDGVAQFNEKIDFAESIEFNNVSFAYPGNKVPVLTELNICIPKDKVVGIVGSSGSGKTTFINLLLGLIYADKGNISIDGKMLKKRKMRNWQKKIGFVPQSIYMSDDTVKRNIAIGLEDHEINEGKVMKAIRQAHISELVSGYENGIHTKVGERGTQLSGGQRQRIGIARALYDNPEVLIFDEATSALDGITEKLVMEAVHDFSGMKTIIMIAHRLTTVENCDIIYFFKKGRVEDSGTYQELIERNEEFRDMASINE